MTVSKGAILIARNNGKLDYVKQAFFLAKRIKHYIGIPVSIITEDIDYLNDSFDSSIFDHIIPLNEAKTIKDVHNLFHHTNIQPLWRKDNMTKRSKLNWAK